ESSGCLRNRSMNAAEKFMGMQALSGLTNSHPLLRAAVKYWWLSIPSGIALYSLIKARPKNTMATVMQDIATSMGPVVGLILLSESLERKEAVKTLTAPDLNSPA